MGEHVAIKARASVSPHLYKQCRRILNFRPEESRVVVLWRPSCLFRYASERELRSGIFARASGVRGARAPLGVESPGEETPREKTRRSSCTSRGSRLYFVPSSPTGWRLEELEEPTSHSQRLQLISLVNERVARPQAHNLPQRPRSRAHADDSDRASCSFEAPQAQKG